ncbi:hypothetical protein ACFE04_006969 [Oxalis oulophora]
MSIIRWPRFLTPTHLSQIISTQKNPLTALQIFNQAKDKYPQYRHNGPVFATMIDILANSGRVNEMREVINQMKEEFCPCKDSVFVTAIKTYASSGLLREAVSLFRNLTKFNCVNWNESFNTLLDIMVRESKLKAAQRLFLESSHGWEVNSRLKSLNLLMDALCKRGQSLLALQVFQEMDFQGCHPDRHSYEILMKGLCEEKRLHEATHVLYSMFWRISQKGSGEDIVVYRILLNALCDNGQVEEAIEILGKILRKGLKAPRRRLRNLDLTQDNDGKDIESTKLLINEALIKGVIPSSDSFNVMAFDLYNEGKFVEAEKVLNVMREKGFWPSLAIYEAKAAALCREGLVSEAVKITEEEISGGKRVPTVKLYNIIIKGLCETGNSKTALGYLKKMSKLVGCVADKDTYGILVDGLCRDGRFDEASRVLEEMLIKSYSPCVRSYNVIIRGLCSIGKQYEAVIWLEEMISQSKLPEVHTWEFLVGSACSNLGKVELIL